MTKGQESDRRRPDLTTTHARRPNVQHRTHGHRGMICALIWGTCHVRLPGSVARPRGGDHGIHRLESDEAHQGDRRGPAWTGIAIGGLMTSFVLTLFMALALAICS